MAGNPFANDILENADSPARSTDDLLFHEEQFDALAFALSQLRESAHLENVPEGEGEEGRSGRERGEMVLLLAPRAGFGKTSLLARLNREFGEEQLIIRLPLQAEQPVGWEALFREVLVHCDAAPASVGEITLLEELARHVFGRLTAELIRKEEIPTANAEQVIHGLKTDAVRIFDFGNEEAEAVKWFGAVFDRQHASFGAEAMRQYGISYEQALFWLRELLDYSRARAGESGPARKKMLRPILEAEISEGEGGAQTRELGARQKLSALSRMLTGVKPLVFVADHLDAFFNDPIGGRELATLLLELPELSPACLTIVSVNVDLWESVFEKALPSAYVDRFLNKRIVLQGITREEAAKLVDRRLRNLAIPDDVKCRFLPMLNLRAFFEDREVTRSSPREILRHARACWNRFEASDYGYGEDPAPGGGAFEVVERSSEPESLPSVPVSEVEFIDLGTSPMPFPGTEAPAELEIPEQRGDDSGKRPGLAERDWAPLPKLRPLVASSSPFTFEPPPAEPGERSDASEPAPEQTDAQANASAPFAKGLPIEPEPASDAPGDAETGSFLEDGESSPALATFQKLLKLISGEDTPEEAGGTTAPMVPEPEPEVERQPEPEPEVERQPEPEPEPGRKPEREADDRAVEEARPRSESDQASLPLVYNRLRCREAGRSGETDLRLDAIERVIRAVGLVLPVVVQKEVELEARSFLCWAHGLNEILFVLEEWQGDSSRDALIEHARQLRRSPGNATWEGSGVEVKTIVLSPARQAAELPAWIGELRAASAGESLFVDLVAVDSDTVGALYAAARLLEQAESGALPHTPADVVALLIRELDYFWRRLTKPGAACPR